MEYKNKGCNLCRIPLVYRGRDLNPHSHHWPKDFKSFVSTDSTTAAKDGRKSTAKKQNTKQKTEKWRHKRHFSVFFPFYFKKEDVISSQVCSSKGVSCGASAERNVWRMR